MTRCVILALDPGNTAGACIASINIVDRTHGPTPFFHGEDFRVESLFKVKQRQEPGVVSRFVETVGADSYVVAAESWSAGGWKSHKTLMGMGANWERWKTALLDQGVAERRIVRVLPREWRSAVLTRAKLTREQWKARAIDYVRREFGYEANDDAAEAALIALWASKDRESLRLGATASRKKLGMEGAA